jgi:DNA-binding LytR/AlgR family response regulator
MFDTPPISCLIADDEPQAREVIKRHISQVPLLQLSGECSNGIEVMSFLQNQSVDLLFLDIQMPQIKGTDLLKILKHPPKVIFTTAFHEYALEGYELDVIDYLLKPIHYDRFLKAVQKVLIQNIKPIEHAVTEPSVAPDAFVYFRADRKMLKVFINDILYIEGMKDYIKVVTSKNTIITKQSITSAEAMLPDSQFIRTHRSFIVSLSKIRSFNNELIEIDKMEIPIGKVYRDTVFKMLS